MPLLNAVRPFVIVFHFIMFASMPSTIHGLGIDTQVKEERVNLLCFNTNTGIALMSRMSILRLRKMSDDGTWKDVAVLKDEGPPENLDRNLTLQGKVGDVFSSFLNATWPLDPEHRHDGKYRCHAKGYTDTGESVEDESAEIDLQTISSHYSQACKRFMESETRMSQKFQDIFNGMNSSFSDMFLHLNSTLKNMLVTLDQKMTEIKKMKENEDEEEEDVSWPKGDFTLLMPDTGCPSNPPAWNKGFVRMNVENNDKYFPLNVPKHLAYPYSKDGFVYQQFCSLVKSNDRQRDWPAGSYCIQTFSGVCPGGFYLTKVIIDMKTDKTGNVEFGTFPTTKNFWADKLYYFCCRHDGKPNTPILLPTSDPFYLYRHQGQCQKVKGMQVTQDIFVMATANDNNGKWGTGLANYRPDLTVEPFSEELCYYTKRK